MSPGIILLAITVLTALVFDFLNGFHDAANSIATVVSTRVLSPRLAVVWAAAFNFLAAFLLGTAVAKTIGKGMIQLDIVTQYVVLAGLVGAIVWDLVTWLLGLPTSSSHALIGGYAGAAMARAAILHGWRSAPRVIIPARLDEDPDLYCGGPGHGAGAGIRLHGGHLLDFPPQVAAPGGQALPQAAVALGGRLQPGTRRQRRAEDHGHRRRRALHGRGHEAERLRRQLGQVALADHPGSQLPRSRWAPTSAAGASCTPWAPRSPS